MTKQTFSATIRDFNITADPETNTLSWSWSRCEPDHELSTCFGRTVDNDNDHQQLPTCFGKIVGITTRPRPDHDMLIFFERAVYGMVYVGGPAMFSFRPIICE
jgi:hypothetical protein